VLRTPYSPRTRPSDDITAKISEEKTEASRIKVSMRVVSPHSVVRQTMEALERGKVDERGLVRSWGTEGCMSVQLSRANLPRGMRILDAFVKGIEERGFVPKGHERKAGELRSSVVEVLGEEIHVALEEAVQRTDHVLTREEEEYKRRHGWSSARKYDYSPTGLLCLRINERTDDRLRKLWSDGKRHRLEDCLNDVLAGLIAVADAMRRDHEEHERRAREWQAEQERLAELERQRHQEEDLRQELLAQVDAWVRSQNIRRFIIAAERAAKEGRISMSPERLQRWLEWAGSQADRLDPLRPERPKDAKEAG
jgi:hypothetical protein